MAWRRMFIQIGSLAGMAAFVLTFWQTMSMVGWQTTAVLGASVRAVGAGGAVLVLALLVLWVINLTVEAMTRDNAPAEGGPAQADSASLER